MKVTLYSPVGKKLLFNDSMQTASGSGTTGNAATGNPPSGQANAVPYPAIPANDGANSLPDSSDEPWYKQFFSGDGNVQNIALRIFAGFVGIGVLVFGGLKVFKNKHGDPLGRSSGSGRDFDKNSPINADKVEIPSDLKGTMVFYCTSEDVHLLQSMSEALKMDYWKDKFIDNNKKIIIQNLIPVLDAEIELSKLRNLNNKDGGNSSGMPLEDYMDNEQKKKALNLVSLRERAGIDISKASLYEFGQCIIHEAINSNSKEIFDIHSELNKLNKQVSNLRYFVSKDQKLTNKIREAEARINLYRKVLIGESLYFQAGQNSLFTLTIDGREIEKINMKSIIGRLFTKESVEELKNEWTKQLNSILQEIENQLNVTAGLGNKSTTNKRDWRNENSSYEKGNLGVLKYNDTTGQLYWYQVLGVSENATKEEVQIAYKQKAKEWHPDLNKTKKDAESMFKKVNEAYEIFDNDINKN